jgi:transcriptional regulator with XRE-family HTH domain
VQTPAAVRAPEHPLLRWRRDHRMSLANLATKAGSTAASLSRIERDQQSPGRRLTQRLAKITGIDPALFDRDPADDDGAS